MHIINNLKEILKIKKTHKKIKFDHTVFPLRNPLRNSGMVTFFFLMGLRNFLNFSDGNHFRNFHPVVAIAYMEVGHGV